MRFTPKFEKEEAVVDITHASNWMAWIVSIMHRLRYNFKLRLHGRPMEMALQMLDGICGTEVTPIGLSMHLPDEKEAVL